MQVLAILSQKGGVGKTTLATCLAVEAEKSGLKTVILDIDPQASASFWHDTRGQDTPVVAAVPAIRIRAMMTACEDEGVDLVVIDGAASARDVTLEAVRHADYVLIPTRTAVFDTMSMTHTLDLVKEQRCGHSVVLTFVSPQGRETLDTIDAIGQLGGNAAPVTIGNRKAFFRAQGQGLAVQEFDGASVAAEEIEALYAYTMQMMETTRDRTLAQSNA